MPPATKNAYATPYQAPKLFRCFLLLSILSLAMALRIAGIRWGLPERLDMHPDEAVHVISHVRELLSRIDLIADHKASFTFNTLDPGFLNYPSFIMYLIGGIYLLLNSIGLIDATDANVFLVGRCISAFFGSITCIAVFLIAEEVEGGMIAAALAALWMALLPLHVWESHIAATDILMSFWITLTLYASLRLLRSGLWRDYLFAGISLGLATGAKYTAALAVVAVLAGALLSRRSLWHTIQGLCLAGLASLVSFFLVAPYSLIRFPDFLKAMRFEQRHTSGFHYGFSLPAVGPQYHKFVYQFFAAWPFSLGFALYACAIIALVTNLFTLDRKRLVLLIFFFVYFGITGSWTFTPLRYYLPVMIVLVIFVGVSQAKWVNTELKMQKCIGITAFLFALGYTSLFTYQTASRYWHETRIEAGKWLDQNGGQDKSFFNIGMKSYLGVPRNPEFAEIKYSNNEKISGIQLEQYNLIQITSIMYNRAYRHQYPFFLNFYENIRNNKKEFTLVKKFESEFINKDLYVRLDPMFEGYFLSPTLEFYSANQ